ncbi:unnamed protein product [Amoebophrya sp. A25]|nr:unnamed protein product [Amoebophrya sp. A25]|eukprot:GSA25T00005396001.1
MSSKYGWLLRHAVDTQKCIAVPGAFCGLAGRIAVEKGFSAAYVSGAALTASAGVPDIGMLTLDHFTKEIVLASGLPLIMCLPKGLLVYRSRLISTHFTMNDNVMQA